MIASYDASDVSQNLLAEILAGKSGIKYFTSNGGPYPLAASTIGNHYFTTDGPFTKNAPVTSNFALRNYDIYHGEIQMCIRDRSYSGLWQEDSVAEHDFCLVCQMVAG